jgi:hypothetical protein
VTEVAADQYSWTHSDLLRVFFDAHSGPRLVLDRLKEGSLVALRRTSQGALFAAASRSTCNQPPAERLFSVIRVELETAATYLVLRDAWGWSSGSEVRVDVLQVPMLFDKMTLVRYPDLARIDTAVSSRQPRWNSCVYRWPFAAEGVVVVVIESSLSESTAAGCCCLTLTWYVFVIYLVTLLPAIF